VTVSTQHETLDSEQAIARAAALAADFAERAAEHDRTASFPFENFAALREANLLNLTVPVEFGGAGLGLATACRVVQQIAAGDAATALVLSMQYIFHAGLARRRTWPEAVYATVCRESVNGIALMNALRVEPELGTPSRGGLPATTATRTSEGWRLTGHKIYATGSPILRYFLVWAHTAEEPLRVGTFLLPREAPGWRIVETWDHLGMRATGSHDIILDGALIPHDHAVDVRPPSEWGAPDPLVGAWNGLVLAALYHGVAGAARDWLLRYLHERVPANFGAPLASLPRFQSTVGEIEALLFGSERLLHGLATEIDAGDGAAAARASLAKYVVTNNAVRAVDLALGLIGNPGLARSNPLERFHRDVLCSRIHSPQDDSILLATGQAALNAAKPSGAVSSRT
jgi:alkylation response protein AidB-like acyl-CoA dehydrogenase